MNRDDKKILKLFQCDFNRNIEETFAQILSENEHVRLFFINEDCAFTDGRNIVVDPAIGGVFADKNALERAENYMKIENHISSDKWYALRMLTRGQNIHECLHILYTDFPVIAKSDKRATSKAKVKTLALISNIIEDAFIEAVGCSEYDNLELYLQFERLATLFSNTPIKGTENEADFDEKFFERMLPGFKTHGTNAKTIGNFNSEGKSITITRRLFTDLDGNPIQNQDFREQICIIVDGYKYDKEAALKILLVKPIVVNWKGADFDCSIVHKDIEIIETKPKPNLNFRRAYQNIYNKYQANINSYNSRFMQLLKARTLTREEKRLFGSGIISNRLADVKKRYWYRNIDEYGVPDIAVLLLIDGSGSMSGARQESAMISSVILHEVLKKQNITHAIVEHRAGFHSPILKINILVGINAKNEEKFNLMMLSADGDNRDGLALLWAERFLNTYTSNSQKLIIVLADGEPAHAYDNYYSPASSKDTQNSALKIIKRGTDIIAVALDDGNNDEYSCYNRLKAIYPKVVSCIDLNRLTGQLLEIISNAM